MRRRFNLLAEEAKSAAKAMDLDASAVEAAELALGPEAFREYAGHFWGFLETRPDMHIRIGLAGTLWQRGDEDVAVNRYREMLKPARWNG